MKNLIMLAVSIVLGAIAIMNEETPKHEHRDFSIIEVYKDSTLVAVVAAIPGDTINCGKYKVIYNKRR